MQFATLEEIKQFYHEERENRNITTIEAIFNKYAFDRIQKLEKRDVQEIHDIISNLDSSMNHFINETTEEILEWICETPNYKLTEQIFLIKNVRLAKKYFSRDGNFE